MCLLFCFILHTHQLDSMYSISIIVLVHYLDIHKYLFVLLKVSQSVRRTNGLGDTLCAFKCIVVDALSNSVVQQEMLSSILIIASSALLVVDLELGLMEVQYPILMENMASVETPTWHQSPESTRLMASTGQANPK